MKVKVNTKGIDKLIKYMRKDLKTKKWRSKNSPIIIFNPSFIK